jgi:hypothetical protein
MPRRLRPRDFGFQGGKPGFHGRIVGIVSPSFLHGLDCRCEVTVTLLQGGKPMSAGYV